MNRDKQIDAFTYYIISNIDTAVLNSLSSKQLSSIKEAIKGSQPTKKHSVDIRGVINLFFIRYYFIFLMGRDQRISTQEIETERRENMALIWNFVFIIFVLSPFILLALIALYFFKTGLGIDLFPGEHIGRIFGL
jgi:hypothetical protein